MTKSKELQKYGSMAGTPVAHAIHELEDRIKFLEDQNKKLKKEVERLTILLKGEE